jgi:hypothetical protein
VIEPGNELRISRRIALALAAGSTLAIETIWAASATASSHASRIMLI